MFKFNTSIRNHCLVLECIRHMDLFIAGVVYMGTIIYSWCILDYLDRGGSANFASENAGIITMEVRPEPITRIACELLTVKYVHCIYFPTSGFLMFFVSMYGHC